MLDSGRISVDAPPSVLVKDLSIERERSRSVRGISFSLRPGGHATLVGAEGTGGRAILQALAGTRRIEQGHVLIGGSDVAAMGYRAMRKHRSRLGYLFHDGALLSHRTLYDNVALPLVYHGALTAAEIRYQVDRRMEQFELSGCGHSIPGDCPYEVRRRALVARALVNDPVLLLLEMPLSGLERTDVKRVQHILNELMQEGGVTVVEFSPEREAGLLLEGLRVPLVRGNKEDNDADAGES